LPLVLPISNISGVLVVWVVMILNGGRKVMHADNYLYDTEITRNGSELVGGGAVDTIFWHVSI